MQGALLKGSLASSTSSATRHLSEMRNCFDKSAEIDLKDRQDFEPIISLNDEFYSEEDDKLIGNGLRAFEDFGKLKNTSKLSSASPLTKSTSGFISGDSCIWGRAESIIRAPLEDVLGYVWNTGARNNPTRSEQRKRVLLEAPNKHTKVEYNVRKFTPPIVDREFLDYILWKTINTRSVQDKEAFVGFFPLLDHARRPVAENENAAVRGKQLTFFHLKKRSVNETRLVLLLQLDAGMKMPNWVKGLFMTHFLRTVTYSQHYFQKHRALQDYDEKDGTALGEALMLRSKAEKKRGMLSSYIGFQVSAEGVDRGGG